MLLKAFLFWILIMVAGVLHGILRVRLRRELTCYGLLAGLHAVARELRIVRAVGETTRTQRLGGWVSVDLD